MSSRNTQERKPVTNSRDTQELLPDAGSEMMRIFMTHEAKTSLLQDYTYYEVDGYDPFAEIRSLKQVLFGSSLRPKKRIRSLRLALKVLLRAKMQARHSE